MKASGQATLDVTFGATTYLQNPIVNYAWDFNGDGTVDLSCNDLSTVTASYLQTGLYLATVTVTDNQGNKYTDTVVVNVLDSEKMKSIFTVIWNNTKTALANKDIVGALGNITENSRDMYSYNFQLMQDHLPSIAQDMQDMGDITAVKIDDSVAGFEMHAVVDGTERAYYIEFIKDIDGSWKLNFF